ncbi:hypothetical protein, partial [Craterilacuibacter sp.]|uniref:hypothetical protein n=1 Tax=Craterilacuibacter sp. TaxID=2870909 RepID=UPI003F3CF857
ISNSTLCEKLSNLRTMGLLKHAQRARQIELTDEAISLLGEFPEKPENSEKNRNCKNSDKSEIFSQFGHYWFPRQAATFLLGKGMREKGVAGLMRECSQAKRQLQSIVTEFMSVLIRYDGEVLYRVLKAIIRDPVRFKPQAVHEKAADLHPAQRMALHRIADGQLPLLTPGESLRLTDEGMSISSPQVRGGAPMAVTARVWQTLNMRARRACEAARPAGKLQSTLDIGLSVRSDTYWIWAGEVKDDRPLIHIHGRTILSDWILVFGALAPAQQQLAIDDTQRDPRIGRWFERAGVRYQVDQIEGGMVMLYTVQANGRRSVSRITIAQLMGDTQIVWQAGAGR